MKYDFMGNSKKSIRKPINKNMRNNVWIKYMGGKAAQGKCYCCGIRTIHITDFDVGHNKSVARGGYNHIDNLRPICRPCNLGMKTKSIEWYKKKNYGKPTTKKSVKKPKTKRLPERIPSGFPTFKSPKFKSPTLRF